MDTIWIQYGYNMDTIWIQYGYNMAEEWRNAALSVLYFVFLKYSFNHYLVLSLIVKILLHTSFLHTLFLILSFIQFFSVLL